MNAHVTTITSVMSMLSAPTQKDLTFVAVFKATGVTGGFALVF